MTVQDHLNSHILPRALVQLKLIFGLCTSAKAHRSQIASNVVFCVKILIESAAAPSPFKNFAGNRLP